jgi:hypothetical protein
MSTSLASTPVIDMDTLILKINTICSETTTPIDNSIGIEPVIQLYTRLDGKDREIFDNTLNFVYNIKAKLAVLGKQLQCEVLVTTSKPNGDFDTVKEVYSKQPGMAYYTKYEYDEVTKYRYKADNFTQHFEYKGNIYIMVSNCSVEELNIPSKAQALSVKLLGAYSRAKDSGYVIKNINMYSLMTYSLSLIASTDIGLYLRKYKLNVQQTCYMCGNSILYKNSNIVSYANNFSNKKLAHMRLPILYKVIDNARYAIDNLEKVKRILSVRKFSNKVQIGESIDSIIDNYNNNYAKYSSINFDFSYKTGNEFIAATNELTEQMYNLGITLRKIGEDIEQERLQRINLESIGKI